MSRENRKTQVLAITRTASAVNARTSVAVAVTAILGTCLTQVHAADIEVIAGAVAGADVVSAAAAAGPEVAEAAADVGGELLGEVVVSARIRSERLQDVPIPVSAIGGDKLAAMNDVTVTDFAKLVPNLLVNAPNARQTSIAIRGIGKNTANDALEPSVGVVVDGVAMAYITQSWGDFPDLDHIEVERGPQGTLLGKNTTLGVVQVLTQAPSFNEAYSATVGVGERNAVNGKFNATGAVVDGVLAYRASFYGERSDGPFDDVAPDLTDSTIGGRNRYGGRVQFLFTPTDTLSARVILDRQVVTETLLWGELPLVGDPANYPNGAARATTYTSRLSRGYFNNPDGSAYTPFVAQGDVVDNDGARPTTGNSGGASAQIDWKLPSFTLTSISAVRNSLFDAHNDADWTHFDIGRNGAIIRQTQVSQELHLNSKVGTVLDYTAGVYFLNSHINSCDRSIYGPAAGAFYANNAQYATLAAAGAVGQQLLSDSLNGEFVYTCTAPTTKSYAGFGQVNWHFTDAGTLTAGVRVTHENKDNYYQKYVGTNAPLARNIAAGVYADADASLISAAQGVLIGVVPANQFGAVAGDPISATSYAWLFNPSYKLSNDVMVYASASHGEKSGAVWFNTTTLTPLNVAPEKALDYELGVKSEFLNHHLKLNVNLYDTEVTDYQQNLTVTDPTTDSGFRTYLGNAPKVRLSGLEFDAQYTLNEYFGVSWNGAYNRAIYADFKDAPCSGDVSAQPGGQQQCDLTGKQLPYAPKWTTSVGPDVHVPLGGRYTLHAYVNEVFRSRANYSAVLSQYGWQGSYSIVDAGVSIGTDDGKWELGFIGKNLFNKWYYQDITTYTGNSAIAAYPGEQRYLGAQLRVNFK